jgi:hypothetical protein
VTVDNNKENFKRFVEHLDDSHAGVWTVANWLNSRGNTVIVPPTTVAKSYEDRLNHVDGGDLFIQQRIEVKVRNLDFTSRDDFPYKDGMLVCAKHSYDNASPKPYAYIYLNKAMTHVALIMSTTSKHWTVKDVKDSRYVESNQLTYECPLEWVIFSKM